MAVPSGHHCCHCTTLTVQTYGLPLTKYLIILKKYLIKRFWNFIFTYFFLKKLLLSNIYSNPTGKAQSLSSELLPAPWVLVLCIQAVHPGKMTPSATSLQSCSSLFEMCSAPQLGGSPTGYWGRTWGILEQGETQQGQEKVPRANFAHEVKEKWIILKQ